jgi:hypothetical protein
MRADLSDGSGSLSDPGPEVELVLRAVAQGLTSFELIGTTVGQCVGAWWDGRALRMSALLYRVALLSLAVERVYDEIGEQDDRLTFDDEAGQVALELLRALDEVFVATYTCNSAGGTIRRSFSAEL